jgi:hypothetical protein
MKLFTKGIVLFAFFLLTSPVNAQQSTNLAIPIVNQSNESPLERRVTQLEEQIDPNERIDNFINFWGVFATVTLAVFGLVGGALIWNGILWRREAKEDLKEIQASKESAVLLLTEMKESNDHSKEVIKEFEATLVKSVEEKKPQDEIKKDIKHLLTKLELIRDKAEANLAEANFKGGILHYQDYDHFTKVRRHVRLRKIKKIKFTPKRRNTGKEESK